MSVAQTLARKRAERMTAETMIKQELHEAITRLNYWLFGKGKHQPDARHNVSAIRADIEYLKRELKAERRARA